MKSLLPLLAAGLFAGCSTLHLPQFKARNTDSYTPPPSPPHQKPVDTSDVARRRFIVGRWFDHYVAGLNFADGVTEYRQDGTFTVAYKSIAPGISENQPTVSQETDWSGKWRIEQGVLIEDIVHTNAPERTPPDRPLMRVILRLDHQALLVQSGNGNVNNYSRKKLKPAKVTFTPNVQ